MLQEVQNAAFQLTFLNTNFFGTNKLNYRVSKESERCIPSMLNINCELTDGVYRIEVCGTSYIVSKDEQK